MSTEKSNTDKPCNIDIVNGWRSFWIYYTDALKCKNKYSLSWAAIPVSWMSLIAIGMLIYSIVDFACR